MGRPNPPRRRVTQACDAATRRRRGGPAPAVRVQRRSSTTHDMTNTMTPLSMAQIRRFREDGALVLRSFIDTTTVASWLDQWEAKTGAICDRPSTWPGKTPDPEWRTEPKLTELPQVQALAVQLAGDDGLTTYTRANVYASLWPCCSRWHSHLHDNMLGHKYSLRSSSLPAFVGLIHSTVI